MRDDHRRDGGNYRGKGGYRDYRDEDRRDSYRGNRETNDNRRGNDRSRNDRGRNTDRRSNRPYGENRFSGPARRTYGEGTNPPRVGRIREDVPQAQRVTGSYRPPRREDFADNRPHHGSAYRAEHRRPQQAEYYEAPEIPEELLQEFTDVPQDDDHILAGRNPIREALKAGRPMEKLLIADGDMSGAGREIVKMAKTAGVVVQVVDRSRLDQIYPAHQGMLAYVAAVPYTPLEDILEAAKAKGEDPFILVLDGITDPHNLGAIIRSAECAGAHGVVVPERRAAGLSPAAAKAAAGALNYMPISRVKNINRALETLKAAGLWIIGTAMAGESATHCDLTGPVALVIGSEGDGVAKLTLEKCDRIVSLPIRGQVSSLNASVAAGILVYEILRQRGQ